MVRQLPFLGKLLICDMDGTLLNEENIVSKENREALEYFVDNGGLLSLATGRTAKGVKKYVSELPINMPIIINNGAQIFDFKTEKNLWKSCLEDDVEDVVRKLIFEFPKLGIEIFSDDGAHIIQQNDVTQWHKSKEVILPGIFEFEKIPKPWYKIVLAWDNSNLKKVEAFLRGNTGTSRTVFAEEVFLDLLNISTSKGCALKRLANIVKIPLSDVIAVGDNLNDLEMIEVAGTGVAVENAHEVLKKSAQFCTVNHNNHAIERVIRFIEESVQKQIS